MKISVISPTELGTAERARWQALQDSNPLLASPCFSHEFTLAAAAARRDVRIAVLEENHRIVGFFPHQQRWGMGLPAGGRLSDHHGVIAAPGVRIDWSELLRRSRLSYWQFDHLTASQHPGCEVQHATSPGLDLSGGFAAYQERRNQASTVLSKLQRAGRKLARDLGPLRFEADCRDDAVFRHVLSMKSQQCRRTGALDFFSWDWTRTLVEQIRATDTEAFGGRVSALYAGQTLVAAHFGMRSRRVWHWWFPVYSHAYAPYSPGLLMLMNVAEFAAAQGHTLLDLGKGDEAYKSRFADCGAPLLEGVVARPTAVTLARQMRHSVGAWARSSPFAQRLRPLIRAGRRATAVGGA
jgi:CelD/BcsL family acetyltransferase involved in cellulose biosynthesis